MQMPFKINTKAILKTMGAIQGANPNRDPAFPRLLQALIRWQIFMDAMRCRLAA
jgi:hypothetical protein